MKKLTITLTLLAFTLISFMGCASTQKSRCVECQKEVIVVEKIEPEPVVRVDKVPEFKPIYFDFDRSNLKAEAAATLDNWIAYLADHPGKDANIIVGHTDSYGGFDYNIKLGKRRADAAKAYLVEKGIAANRITCVSKGEDEPATTNATPEGRAENRRAVLDVQ